MSYLFTSVSEKKSKVAVNNLNMDVENNKITVLLGHNGAGKTTTINMIVGMFLILYTFSLSSSIRQWDGYKNNNR